ncbi:MAG: hypothetical protein K2J85_07265, partial [Anaeroplasmataceae bacterium]|nr:hypothetical protein [Anaeroplasmataceae bacterium]
MSCLLGIILSLGLGMGGITSTNIIKESNQDVCMKEESITYTPEVINYQNDLRDPYESNDSYETATKLSPNNFYSLDSYSANIVATLYDGPYMDYDLYYITLLTDSLITIECSGYDNTNVFEFILMQVFYPNCSSEEDKKILRKTENIYEDDSKTSSKYFSEILDAGTYYILVKPHNDFTKYIAIYYSMNVNVVKSTASYKDASIADMKYNKNLQGALWISDYTPINNNLFFDPNLNLPIYKNGQTGIDEPDYALQSLMSITNENIQMASLYIWGKEYKHILANYAKLIYEEMTESLKAEQELIIRYDGIENNTNLGINIGFSILSISNRILFQGKFSIALSALKMVSLATIDLIFKLITPKISIQRIFY